MKDAPKTGSLRLEALLHELSQLRIANAEREQEMSCLKALQELSPREEVPFDQLQRMIDLVPHGFLAPKEVSVQVRISEHVFSTPGFQSAQESHSTLIYWDEQEVGELLVHVTGQTRDALPIPLEKQRFLSLVADRFGECIQVWSMMAATETSKQDLIKLELQLKELKEARERWRRRWDAISEFSVPIVEIWDGVLFMPISNVLESEAASVVWVERASTTVFEKEAYFVIIDVGGLVGALDDIEWLTIDNLLKMVRVVGLLGATTILTGMQPHVAKRISSLDIHLDSLLIHGTFRNGLRDCIRRMKAIKRMERLRRRSLKEQPERK